MFKFSYYANLGTDDVDRHRWCDTQRNKAVLLKLGKDVAPYEIYQMVHILMLLWKYSYLFKMKYYHLRLNKAKYLVSFKTYTIPTLIR